MTVSLDVAQQSAVFRFMVLLKKEPKEIHEVLVATFNDNALSHAIVKKRAALFKAGRESVGDDSQSGRSTCAVTDERVKDVKKFVVKEGRISIRHIASEISISVESVLKPSRSTLVVQGFCKRGSTFTHSRVENHAQAVFARDHNAL